MKRLVVWVGLLCIVALAPAASACPLRFRLRPFASGPVTCPPPVKPMAYADDKANLRLKFAKGKDFYVESTTVTKQKMKVMGQDVKQTQEQVFVQHWQPQRMTANGDWVVHVRIVHIIMKMDIGGNRIDYDSWDETRSRTPINEFFDALLKVDFTVIVQPDGGIRKIEGRHKLLKEIASASPGSGTLMNSMLSDAALKKAFTPMGSFLPDAGVAPGDGWTRKDTLDLGPIGRYATTFKYTYHAAQGSAHEIRVKASITYTPPDKADGLPFLIKSAELESTGGEGKIVFDAEKGRLRDSSLAMRLSGTLVIEVGGMESRVELEQAQTSRVRTMDTYARPGEK